MLVSYKERRCIVTEWLVWIGLATVISGLSLTYCAEKLSERGKSRIETVILVPVNMERNQ